MPSAENLSNESRFMGIMVGPAGAGKTVAECSFPKPILVLDFDLGITGLLGAPWIDRKDIEYESFPPRSSINEKPVYMRINEKADALMAMYNMGKLPYKTIVCDSLSSQTFAVLCDSITLTHVGEKNQHKGKWIGGLQMPDPGDYGFEAIATKNLISFLRSIPVNVLVSAHVVETFKRANPDDPYSEKIADGEKLSVRDKIGAEVMIYFKNVFRFDRVMKGNKECHTVQFRGDIARTNLARLPPGVWDITNKHFYSYMMSLANGVEDTVNK